jgi:hypothetical protein
MIAYPPTLVVRARDLAEAEAAGPQSEPMPVEMPPADEPSSWQPVMPVLATPPTPSARRRKKRREHRWFFALSGGLFSFGLWANFAPPHANIHDVVAAVRSFAAELAR